MKARTFELIYTYWSDTFTVNIEEHKQITLYTQAKTINGLVKAVKKEYPELNSNSYNFVKFTEIFYEYK